MIGSALTVLDRVIGPIAVEDIRGKALDATDDNVASAIIGEDDVFAAEDSVTGVAPFDSGAIADAIGRSALVVSGRVIGSVDADAVHTPDPTFDTVTAASEKRACEDFASAAAESVANVSPCESGAIRVVDVIGSTLSIFARVVGTSGAVARALADIEATDDIHCTEVDATGDAVVSANAVGDDVASLGAETVIKLRSPEAGAMADIISSAMVVLDRLIGSIDADDVHCTEVDATGETVDSAEAVDRDVACANEIATCDDVASAADESLANAASVDVVARGATADVTGSALAVFDRSVAPIVDDDIDCTELNAIGDTVASTNTADTSEDVSSPAAPVVTDVASSVVGAIGFVLAVLDRVLGSKVAAIFVDTDGIDNTELEAATDTVASANAAGDDVASAADESLANVASVDVVARGATADVTGSALAVFDRSVAPIVDHDIDCTELNAIGDTVASTNTADTSEDVSSRTAIEAAETVIKVAFGILDVTGSAAFAADVSISSSSELRGTRCIFVFAHSDATVSEAAADVITMLVEIPCSITSAVSVNPEDNSGETLVPLPSVAKPNSTAVVTVVNVVARDVAVPSIALEVAVVAIVASFKLSVTDDTIHELELKVLSVSDDETDFVVSTPDAKDSVISVPDANVISPVAMGDIHVTVSEAVIELENVGPSP